MTYPKVKRWLITFPTPNGAAAAMKLLVDSNISFRYEGTPSYDQFIKEQDLTRVAPHGHDDVPSQGIATSSERQSSSAAEFESGTDDSSAVGGTYKAGDLVWVEGIDGGAHAGRIIGEDL